jgi:hypothetical protein
MRLNDAHLGQLARILERKRGQADGIERLEDSGVGADAERQGEQRDSGETGVIAQHAQGVADILEQGGHRSSDGTKYNAETFAQNGLSKQRMQF